MLTSEKLRVAVAWVACLGVLGANARLHGEEPKQFTSAEEIRRLSPEDAEQRHRVHLHGVLTFYDQRTPSKQFRFLQDETAGIYIHPAPGVQLTGAAAGQRVEVEGYTGRGEFAPVVMVERLSVLGAGSFPPARPVSFEQLSSGQQDSQFVEVSGVVRSVRLDEQRVYFVIEVASGEGRVTVYTPELAVTRSEDLIDSTVRVRGVCFTQFNRQRQLFNFGLLVPRVEDLVVEKTAPADPWARPQQPIKSLLRYSAQGSSGHRLRVVGTVTLRFGDKLFIQDAQDGLCVQTRQTSRVEVGERVEVLGFPARGQYTPIMESGIYRKVEPAPPVKPETITVDDALKGDYDCRLVTIQAVLLDRAQHSQEPFLVLQGGGFVFHAYLREQNADLERLQKGSRMSVTGVCVIEAGEDWHYGDDWRAASFRLLMRSPADIGVLAEPPWWTLRKLFWALGALVAVALGALAWGVFLRRRVRAQTRIINEKLQIEAALKERYVELFENANDVVLTHDLSGRLTSINTTGEQLLQRGRGELLSRSVVDLVAEEQRPAAAQWLEQVVKGAEPPGAEWDFLNAAGQPVKLELNTRLIEQHGKPFEVEVIGRDITERRRLEQEILEISNKEQRRIGHDLHDGVCQQLAAIAFRTHILARKLQDKAAPESAEAESIGASINDSLVQTRGVAQGLFPVRLEENGLVSALEELSANTSKLFGIRCVLTAAEPLPEVQNSVGLHIYYIAQEAVLNAARHSKGRNIRLELAQQAEQLVLRVQDDGAGFKAADVNGGGMGIAIMRYRARVIGGTLELKWTPGQGTRLICTFPASTPKSLPHD